MVVGLAGILLGGPVFALLMVVIGLSAVAELERMLHAAGAPSLFRWLPTGAVVLAGGIGWRDGPTAAAIGLGFVGMAGSLVAALRRPASPSSLLSATLSTTAAFYFAIPVFTAVSLRNRAGPIEHAWLAQLAERAALAWPAGERGLGWVLLAVVVVWVGDSAAYLGGRALGRTRLAPLISPNKTVEGAGAGLAGSVLAAVAVNAISGLNLALLVAIAVGLCLGLMSQLGDLVESLVKRQLGVKDSGSLIPGHGGVLDRVDSLLFALPTAWILANLIDGARQ